MESVAGIVSALPAVTGASGLPRQDRIGGWRGSRQRVWRRIAVICLVLAVRGMASAAWAGPPALPPGVNPDLPVHREKKLHPEISDPVLGDKAAIVEWAWSPQYAARFGLPVQEDGLKDGPLWLVGVKVVRLQGGKWQTYHCRIAGLIENRLPIVWPPGEMYVVNPGYLWAGGLPGKVPGLEGMRPYDPGQAAWYREPKTHRERKFPKDGIGTPYLAYIRNYQADLAYFELEGGCAYFKDPEQFRNELRFPTRIDGKNDDIPGEEAVFEPSAIVFDLPDGLMHRIYPYTQEANAWGGCLMRRIGGKPYLLPLWALRSGRFKGLCEREGGVPPNR